MTIEKRARIRALLEKLYIVTKENISQSSNIKISLVGTLKKDQSKSGLKPDRTHTFRMELTVAQNDLKYSLEHKIKTMGCNS